MRGRERQGPRIHEALVVPLRPNSRRAAPAWSSPRGNVAAAHWPDRRGRPWAGCPRGRAPRPALRSGSGSREDASPSRTEVSPRAALAPARVGVGPRAAELAGAAAGQTPFISRQRCKAASRAGARRRHRARRARGSALKQRASSPARERRALDACSPSRACARGTRPRAALTPRCCICAGALKSACPSLELELLTTSSGPSVTPRASLSRRSVCESLS